MRLPERLRDSSNRTNGGFSRVIKALWVARFLRSVATRKVQSLRGNELQKCGRVQRV